MDYRDLVAEAKQSIEEIDAAELAALPPGRTVVIDVREPDEHALGAVPGSMLVPRGILESTIPTQIMDTSTPIVLYCAVGNRSALAAASLTRMGYHDVVSLQGGFEAWKKAGLSWHEPEGLTTEQRARYSRHLLLGDVGEKGQRRLLDARVLVVGAGGLGSPAALYLAAAGVGTLGIVDADEVDLSNLQRQILHTVDRIGTAKVDSARRAVHALNPDVEIEAHPVWLGIDNAIDLVKAYDVVVDGADNFPTRYLVNDASLHTGVPVVHASIFRFEGQATVFEPFRGPCYRCLFRLPPPPELAPSCSEAGVLGVLPGILGSIQAVEAIKLILGVGTPLTGRLLTYDALGQEFRTLNIRRDPDCPACRDEASPPVLVAYDEACLPVTR
ncbi:MAG: molybdopterin-synthase adenylyltransferase MoeB [Acidimicrobiia bacterium]